MGSQMHSTAACPQSLVYIDPGRVLSSSKIFFFWLFPQKVLNMHFALGGFGCSLPIGTLAMMQSISWGGDETKMHLQSFHFYPQPVDFHTPNSALVDCHPEHRMELAVANGLFLLLQQPYLYDFILFEILKKNLFFFLLLPTA